MKRPLRLIQIQNNGNRRVALVEEPKVRLLRNHESIHGLALAAISTGDRLGSIIERDMTDETMEYDSIWSGNCDWRLLVPIDHPKEASRCLVSGTGLTHLGSAKDRQSMHKIDEAATTDSMRMFKWGLEGGRPEPGRIGIAPEWFYKGVGTVLRAHGEPLVVPSFGEDGGEEAEIAGIYVVDPSGIPRRIGMAIGNEFSDHRFEKRNYLNLAGSKMRTCSLGPELVVDPDFESVPGKVSIERNGRILWSKEIVTGEAEMCHNLGNIEHHHFKFEPHRRPGDVHVHYYGAHSLSFGDGIQLADGDVMVVEFSGFGRPLRNPLRTIDPASDALIKIQPLR
jgi:hypothetical protein